MFQKASRLKLRFNSPNGLLTVEDLWDIPLISANGKVCIDEIAKDLAHKLKEDGVKSFVLQEEKSDGLTQLKFDIVRQIIEVRLAERDLAQHAAANREKIQAIMAVMARKESKHLEDTSMDDLQKLLKELQAQTA